MFRVFARTVGFSFVFGLFLVTGILISTQYLGINESREKVHLF